MKLPAEYSKLDWRKGEKAKIREEYIKLQKGLCYYCNKPLSKKYKSPKEITNKSINWALFPKGFLNHPIHLQHNHNTDMTEGGCSCLLQCCIMAIWRKIIY